MAGTVQRIARRLLRVAKDHVVEFTWVNPGALNGALAGNGAEFLSGEILQLAAVASKGRTRPAHNCNVPWFQHWFPSLGFYTNSCDQKRSEWTNQTC
jgi:hypothetical protein